MSSILVISSGDELCIDLTAQATQGLSVSCTDSIKNARSTLESGHIDTVLLDLPLTEADRRELVAGLSHSPPTGAGHGAESLAQKYAALVEFSEDAIFIKSLEGIVLTWNHGAELMYGWRAEEIIGQSLNLLLPPERRGEIEEILARIRKGEHIQHFESTRLRKDGTVVDVSLSVSPIRDAAGRITGACTIARDITERRHRQDLLESEVARKTAEVLHERDFVESLFQVLPGVIGIRDTEGRLIRWNREYERVTGYSPEELKALPADEVVEQPEDMSTKAAVAAVLMSGQSVGEVLLKTKDGRRIPYLVTGIKGRYGGQPVSVAIGIDISPLKEAERLLREQNAFSETLIESLPGLFVIRDLDSNILKWNKNIERVLGYDSEDLRNFGTTPLVASPSGEALERIRLRVASGEAAELEVVFKTKTGESLPHFAHIHKIDYLGRPAIMYVAYDISEIRRTMEALRASEARTRLLGDVATAANAAVTAEEVYDAAARAMARFAGFPLVQLYLPETGAGEELSLNLARSWESDETESFAVLKSASARRAPVPGEAVAGLAFSLQTPTSIANFDDAPGYPLAVVARAAGLKSAHGFPVLAQGKVAGVFEFFSAQPGRLAPARSSDLVLAIGLVQTAVERILAVEALREREASSQLLKSLAVSASATTSVESAFALALRSIAEYLGCEVAHVYLPRRSRDLPVRLETSELWYLNEENRFAAFKRQTASTGFLPGEGFIGRAFLSKRPLWLPSIHADRGFSRASGAAESGLQSGLALPISVEGSCVAILEFYATRALLPNEGIRMHMDQVLYTLEVAMARISAEEKIAKLSEIVEQGPTGVVTLDKEGGIDYVNSRYCDMTGYSAEELLGKPAEFLVRGSGDPGVLEALKATLETGSSWRGELVGRKKDGRSYWESAAVFPVLDRRARLLSHVAILDDVSATKSIEADLQAAKAEADRANRAKSDFLAQMSHEIRTPLNAIIGLTTLALKVHPEAKLADYLRKIHFSSNILLELINDILDFSKIEVGKIEIEQVSFDLEQLVHGLCSVISIRAAEKGVEIVVSMGPQVPWILVGDPHRLNQILLNLLNNAVKFTERGEILLAIDVAQRVDHRVELNLTVRDTGIGMTNEQLGRLFRPFTQAESTITRKYGGTGLGLAICKQLIELMDGSISVSSEPGKGSEFSLRLPFVVVEEREPRPKKPVNLRGASILVVEDNASSATTLRQQLETLSFRSVLAGSGRAALDLLQDENQTAGFALVLVDMSLGDMNGIGLVRRIRALPNRPGAIVVLMGYESERAGIPADSAELGIAAFLEKPISPSMLINTLVNALAGETQHLPSYEESLVAPKPEWQRLRGAAVLLAEDNEINQQIALELLEAAGVRLTLARTGVEAVTMLKAGGFDAVLMDIQMPEMDGITATRLIREDPRFSTMPIIAMTADVFSVSSRQFEDTGMNDFVYKPIDEAQLLDTLTRWLGHGGETGRPGATEARAVPGDAEEAGSSRLNALPGLDLETGLSRVRGNETLYRRILRKFRDHEMGTAELIEQALRAGDLAAARQLAHAFKGVAGNIGAAALHRRLTELGTRLQAGEREEALGLVAEVSSAALEVMRSIEAYLEPRV